MAGKEVEKMDKKQAARERELLIRPRCSVCEEADGNILLRLEMPGVAKENLDINVDSGELTITGRRPAQASSGVFLVRERPQGSFRQVYTLDDTIDSNRIDAALEGGVLNLTLHRKESEKPRKITVRG